MVKLPQLGSITNTSAGDVLGLMYKRGGRSVERDTDDGLVLFFPMFLCHRPGRPAHHTAAISSFALQGSRCLGLVPP